MRKTFLACLMLTGFAAHAEERVVMVVDGIKETRNLPALVAESLGYFKEEGLLVTLMEGRDEVPTEDLLMDGRADMAMAFYHHTFMAQAKGKPILSVATLAETPALKLMVAAKAKDRIHGVADLKGAGIYTGGANSGKTTAMNWLMQSAGLGLDDIRRLQPNGRDAIAAALADGGADAVMSHEPDAGFYQSHGYAWTLVDLSSTEGTRKSLGHLFPTTSVYLVKSYAEAHPATVQHVVNAVMKALAFINSHSAQEIADKLPKEVGGKSRETYLQTLAEDKGMFAASGLIDEGDAREEWKVMAAFQPKYGEVKIAETYTNAFVEAYLRSRR